MARRFARTRSVSRRNLLRANRIEELEVRLALSGSPWEGQIDLGAKTPNSFPSILTTWLPDGVSRADLAAQAGPYASSATAGSLPAAPTSNAPGSITSLLAYNELEPVGVSGLNDTPGTAELIAGFGTGLGDDPSADVSGDLMSGASSVLVPLPEDEGSIPLATPTGLTSGNSVTATAVIGDGPFGFAGTGSGDFDFYAITGRECGIDDHDRRRHSLSLLSRFVCGVV